MEHDAFTHEVDVQVLLSVSSFLVIQIRHTCQNGPIFDLPIKIPRSHTNQTVATMASAAPSPAASASKPQAGTQSSKRSGKQAKKKTRGGIERACKLDSGDSAPVCRRYVVQFTFDHLEHALPEFDAILRALGVDADSCYEQYVWGD